MWKAFPLFSRSVVSLHPALVVRVRDLPPKPWPLIIVGLPVIFTTEEHMVGFEYDRLVSSSKKALHDYDAKSRSRGNHSTPQKLFNEQELFIPYNLAGFVVFISSRQLLLSVPKQP
jgi:hypothetical protein